MRRDIAICWFRQDLRLADNLALTAAAAHKLFVAVYILDDKNAGDYAMGAASRWWLHHSLQALNQTLGGALSLYRGDPLTLLLDIAERHKACAVYWNRCYEPWRVRRDMEIKTRLRAHGIEVRSFNGSLLWEPQQIAKKDGTPYQVFTPFYRHGCLNASPPRTPLPAPSTLPALHDTDACDLLELPLLPPVHWYTKLVAHWRIGEYAAEAQLQHFLAHGLADYAEGRDFPARPYTSRLSPHLHFGEISPNQVWHEARQRDADDENVDRFCCELGWREFSYHLLYHHPTLPHQNLQQKFNRFPWRKDKEALSAWQEGRTGIPLVDAGMRELWQTGYMHNRVRMIVASFLVKNLMLHWRHGERWFWDTLVDADLANNSASWQWVAGCGADAAPFFRVFNPVLQGRKFDADGEYLCRFVPELESLPPRYMFCPWEAPPDVLADAGVVLGTTYPKPIADLSASRKIAVAAFCELRDESLEV